MDSRKVEASSLTDQIEQEIHNNQGDAAESFVRGLLQRRGFTVNVSEKDRWGWDLSAEHTTPRILGRSALQNDKLEFKFQVKSTRVVDKNTVQISLSALHKLISSQSVCVVAYVVFAADADLPESIHFIHVGKEIISNVHQALLLNQTSLTIQSDGGIQFLPTKSRSTDLYDELLEFRKEFPGNYSYAKQLFINELVGYTPGERKWVEGPSGAAKLTFSYRGRKADLDAVVHRSYCGPELKVEYRNAFCSVSKSDMSVAWFLDKEAPISEMASAIEAMEIIQNDGWSFSAEGDVAHESPFSLGHDVRSKDMKQVSSLVNLLWLACREHGVDPVVDFRDVGGQMFSDPTLNDVVWGGGLIRPGKQSIVREGSIHRLSTPFFIEEFVFSVTWMFTALSEDVGIIRVGPGTICDVRMFETTEQYRRFHEHERKSRTLNFAEAVFSNGYSRSHQPAVLTTKPK